MVACSGTEEEIDNFKHNFTHVSVYFLVVLVSLQVIVTIGATIYIYTMRKFSEIPLFVTIQMVLLNGFSASVVAFFARVYVVRQEDKVGEISQVIMNMPVTFGDFFFILHDWIFTE